MNESTRLEIQALARSLRKSEELQKQIPVHVQTAVDAYINLLEMQDYGEDYRLVLLAEHWVLNKHTPYNPANNPNL